MKRAIAASLFALGIGSLPHMALAQDASVYTASQAQQGAALYSRQCTACHGAALEGGVGPALKGDSFKQLAASQSLNVKSLMDVMSKTMPMTAPGSLKPEDYAALTAFILQQSGYPAGNQALNASNPGLDKISLGGGATASSALSAAQSAPTRNASSGVYTAAQAAHGKTLYGDNCLQCHGGELDGVEDAPPLAGKPFMSKWGSLSVGAVHAFIDRNMPPGNGGALGANQEADVVAYILSKNNFPAGPTPLPADPAGLNAIPLK
jgi:mono/diheme cytochrome c family protein